MYDEIVGYAPDDIPEPVVDDAQSKYVENKVRQLQFIPFSRPKAVSVESRPGNTPKGQPYKRMSVVTSERNKSTVSNMMTCHPPLPSRQPRSYASFQPNRYFRGPILISNNMLESILHRAKNTMADVGEFLERSQQQQQQQDIPKATATDLDELRQAVREGHEFPPTGSITRQRHKKRRNNSSNSYIGSHHFVSLAFRKDN